MNSSNDTMVDEINQERGIENQQMENPPFNPELNPQRNEPQVSNQQENAFNPIDNNSNSNNVPFNPQQHPISNDHSVYQYNYNPNQGKKKKVFFCF